MLLNFLAGKYSNILADNMDPQFEIKPQTEFIEVEDKKET